jgi:Tfp pilus assembly protein PilF
MRKTILATLMASLLVLTSCATITTRPEAESKDKARDFAFYFDQGTASLKQGNYGAAVGQFDKAILLDPNSDKAHNLLAIAHINLKNYSAAERELQKAVLLNPQYFEAYNNLGGVYFLRQQFEKAEEMFKKALAVGPDSIPANYGLGTLLLLQGRMEEGTRYLTRGIELDPDYLETHKTLSADVRTSDSDQSLLYFAYAKIYAARGDVEKTLDFFQKAKATGFREWRRVASEKDFEKVREDPRIKNFLREK